MTEPSVSSLGRSPLEVRGCSVAPVALASAYSGMSAFVGAELGTWRAGEWRSACRSPAGPALWLRDFWDPHRQEWLWCSRGGAEGTRACAPERGETTACLMGSVPVVQWSPLWVRESCESLIKSMGHFLKGKYMSKISRITSGWSQVSGSPRRSGQELLFGQRHPRETD